MTERDGVKLHWRGSCWVLEGMIFTERVSKLAREVVMAPSLSVFQNRLDSALRSVVQLLSCPVHCEVRSWA